ncbi:MAG TPA: hypothetical protein VMB21_11605 [Candidatus Limnocylindria bacterium]|nr:hypothetical protein [Candidatus Limnocylindria bacterium]
MKADPAMALIRRKTRTVIALLGLAWLTLGPVGCSEKPKSEPTAAKAAAIPPATADVAATPAPAEAVASVDKAPTPAADQQVCFECQGTGRTACHHPGCDHGFVECPGPCLKRSSKWEHAVIPGHAPDELWHMIHIGNGRKQPVSQGHIGEVFVVSNGEVQRVGKCQQCNGRGQIGCPTCKGKGTVPCELCAGQKVIPAAWKTNDNPVLNRQPDLLRLKDGRLFLGKTSELGERVYIRTRDGQFITVGKDDFEEEKPAK